MRHYLRFLAFCCVAALTAGCSDSNDNSGNGAERALAPTAELCSSIGDRVWLDQNCNGFNDDGEPGVAGVTVQLKTCDGATLNTTTTDANGFYLFDNLDNLPDYRICVIPPPGYKFAPLNQGGVEGRDSDFTIEGCNDVCLEVDHCKAPRWIDAGLCLDDSEGCASIGDRVWLDANCDGIQDGGEVGVPGVTVNLETCAGAFVGSTVTDGNGNYLFDNLDDTIDYRVCFVLPAGYTFSPANQGGVEASDSDAGANGCTDCIDVNDCKEPRFVDAGVCRDDEEAEGCTPGFWKNHFSWWEGTGYSPGDSFDSVFGCALFGDGTTLESALMSQGTLNNLAYHAVAALLNAAHPDVDYAYTVDEVKDIVCDAVASGDLEGGKDTLADANEENCPLGGDDDDDDDDEEDDDDDDDEEEDDDD